MGKPERYQAEPATTGQPSNFIVMQDGRIAYFPFAPSGRGYVIPDADRERDLREAHERFRKFNRYFLRYVSLALGSISLFAFFFILQRPSFEALCWLVGPIAVAVFFARCAFIWFAGQLIWGLEHVGGDPGTARAFWRLGIVAAVAAALIWLILHLYDARLYALKGDLGVFTFYPGLSRNIMFAIISGMFLFGTLSHFDRFVERVGKTRARLGIAFLALLELIAVVTGVVTFFGSTPKVTITRDFLICGTPTRWSDVAAISLVDGRRGNEYAKILLKSANPPPPPGQFIPLLSRQYGPTTDCEISDLETDYNEVYRAIEMAWRQASSRSH